MIKINLENISKSFGDKKVLDNINITFKPNKIYGLLGNNGVGKTTLVKIIFNEFNPSSGKITHEGTEANDWFYFSENEELPISMTVKSYLMYIASLSDIKLGIAKERIEKAYSSLDLNFKLNQKIKKLSSGQKKMVSCLALLVLRPHVVFLDEPTANLDVENKDKVLSVVEKLKGPDTIIVIVTHLLKEVENVLDEAVIIDAGKVTFEGSLKNKDIQKVFKDNTKKNDDYKDKIGDLIDDESK